MADDEKGENKITRREFLRRVGLIGGAGALVTLDVFLLSEPGKKFVKKVLSGELWQKNEIETDEGSKRLLNAYNEILANKEGLTPMELAARDELERRRNVVLAADQKGLIDLQIKYADQGVARTDTRFLIDAKTEKAKVMIGLENTGQPDMQLIKGLSHELAHVYQYLEILDKFGFKSPEMDDFTAQAHKDVELEKDAWVVGNLAGYLFAKKFPGQIAYGELNAPTQVGVDEIGFTGYWLNGKNQLPKNFGQDAEFSWFIERWLALVDVYIDVASGKPEEPMFPIQTRDSAVGVKFIAGARHFFVETKWSESIGMEMDPTESNVFIGRYFWPGMKP